jgi:hypothetical protein
MKFGFLCRVLKMSASCCCQGEKIQIKASWIVGSVQTKAGQIPLINPVLGFSDRLRSGIARSGIRRMHYRVEPGLYAVGQPTDQSPVFVTANYKMSFDHLRSQLGGIDGWILVLDTKGINVWCAAGKGTFGTDELAGRVKEFGLDRVVAHRRLILPQLGATGVSAHQVQKLCGFKVTYGPVRARDLPAFMRAGMKATPDMRRVMFSFRDRVVLIPTEVIQHAKYLLLVVVAFLLLSGLGGGGYSLDRVATYGVASALLLLLAYLSGTILPPALLPWLPGRPFSLKGAWIGSALALGVAWYGFSHPHALEGPLTVVAWLFLLPAITSFIAMNFTGSSTYTSLSGVRKEMRTAVPIQISAAVVGLGLWIAGLFV